MKLWPNQFYRTLVIKTSSPVKFPNIGEFPYSEPTTRFEIVKSPTITIFTWGKGNTRYSIEKALKSHGKSEGEVVEEIVDTFLSDPNMKYTNSKARDEFLTNLIPTRLKHRRSSISKEVEGWLNQNCFYFKTRGNF